LRKTFVLADKKWGGIGQRDEAELGSFDLRPYALRERAARKGGPDCAKHRGRAGPGFKKRAPVHCSRCSSCPLVLCRH
jgi:hypothetical protein